MATVFERLRHLLVTRLEVSEDEILPVTRLSDDLGIDSLDMVDLVMAIEDEFSVRSHKLSIPDEDIDKFVTVQDIVDYLYDTLDTDAESPPQKNDTMPLHHQTSASK